MTNLRTAYSGLWLSISNCSQIQKILLKLSLIPEGYMGDELSMCFSISVSKGTAHSHKQKL